MPNIESKNKSVRSSNTKAIANKSFKSEVKTAIKRAKLGLIIKDNKVKELINHACSMVDKAVSQKIFHENKAARIKSKLMKRHERNETILAKDHKIEEKIKAVQTKPQATPAVKKEPVAKKETAKPKVAASKTTVKKDNK